MTEKTKIRSILIAAVLLLSFVLPIVTQATHFCEDHEHSTPSEKSTYAHEKSADCSICDFHFPSFVYHFINFSDFIPTSSLYKAISVFTADIFTHNYNLSFSLRGPPSLLFA